MMRLVLTLEPASDATARIMSRWQALWGVAKDSDELELASPDSLSALLDLRSRCFDQGITVNAVFPDNQ